MATLTFETLTFTRHPDHLRVVFLKYYYCTIPLEDLLKIGEFTVTLQSITFPTISEKTLQNKFSRLLARGFEHLTNSMTGKKTFYIHQNSGIPLFGTRYIGIQDRGTNFLEIKPLTGCHLGCMFCSVDEGVGSKKQYDFVVERTYLVQEATKLLDFKQCKNMHLFINVHGEPLLYADLVGLIQDLAQIHWVRNITLITSGSLLTTEMIDQLATAGLTHINISISAIDAKKAKEVMGTNAYNIERIKELVRHATKKIKLTLAPVWMDGINDAEMEGIIAFGKEVSCPVRIQKFCYNKFGRNPVEELSWEEFFAKINHLEKKTGVSLKADHEAYMLEKTKEYPMPFRKGDVIEAKIIVPGRYSHERICIAKERLISVPFCKKDAGRIRINIVKALHNVFQGECL